jgi:chromosome condensin MukBEF MukE localization factor
VVAQLAVVLGSDALIRAFNPKRRRYDERVAQKTVRTRVAEAIRQLAALGFVDLGDDGPLRLRPALLRFAEPVRGLSAPAEALAKLVATGEVELVVEDGGDDGEGERDDELEDDIGEPEDAAADPDGRADADPPADADGREGADPLPDANGREGAESPAAPDPDADADR